MLLESVSTETGTVCFCIFFYGLSAIQFRVLEVNALDASFS